eukprot:gene15731-33220_t
MTTKGDQILDRSLSKVGGKGLFVKELEVALEEGRAHIAVHSLKDVPMELPEGFALACVMEREDPRDAWVSSQYARLEDLPPGAVVGTSSLRRQAQWLALRPDLKIHLLRGNVNTRLAKLDAGEYDGSSVGVADGNSDGVCVGTTLGCTDGEGEGATLDGDTDGVAEGLAVGTTEGWTVGSRVGATDGDVLGVL